MKVSKRNQNLFFVALFVIFFSLSIAWTVTNSFIMFVPPADGTWEITGTEIINQDTLLNGSIDINYGGELIISDCTITFQANSTFSPEIINDGTLIIDNSTVTIIDNNFIIYIESKASSILTIQDSTIENTKIYARAEFTQVTFQSNQFSNCSEVKLENLNELEIDDCTFVNSDGGLILDGVDYFNLTGNTFDTVDFGVHIIDTKSGSIENNQFLDIANTGLQISRSPSGLSEAIIIDNNFISNRIGMDISKTTMQMTENVLDLSEKGMILYKVDRSLISNNNFTNLIEVCIEVSGTLDATISENLFLDSNDGLIVSQSILEIYANDFNNLTNAIFATDSDEALIHENDFVDITATAVEITDCWDPIIFNNVFSGVRTGISILRVRRSLLEQNLLLNVEEGISIISSRGVEIIGNSIENTITGIYLEQSKDLIITANGAINATYGVTIWSSTNAILASNGVLDSVYGFSIWFSENVKLAGNEVNTSDIGIIARNTLGLRITDGNYRVLVQGLQIIGSENAIITGNSFTNITTSALFFRDSNGFVVYHNNFEEVTAYGEIDNCIGSFEYNIDNETIKGNYYEGEPAGVPVFIDTVTISLFEYDIIDNHPLSSQYNVKPTIEFVTRDISNPTDQEEVTLESQVFVPVGIAVQVYIQYIINENTTWENVDITLSETPVGSIGAINQFSGTIPAFPYDYSIVYRLKITYLDESNLVELTTENDSYVVLTSDVTPIIIFAPEIRVEAIIDDEVTTVSTKEFYEDIEFIIVVRVTNRTDLDILSGKRRVNLTWSEKDPETNETHGFTDLMTYNETTNIYFYELGKGYPRGTIIDYFISVVDINGTTYRTVFNYTIEVTTEAEESGFDTITLLGIGGTLLVVQAMVVLRRRKRRKREE
ncbi:MAG: right-handed parallel beta-helix repeat-containing protein [Candidatus Heimdallarchaeota archaeon]|nr:right-handed parallel beta-helix repeat-containing protein [Candidatus Heimdallarchaeota archaeon]MCK4955276.1 right-handed parallel beta-helix repeat-containing protein [Candidatus Heimdallarchaeota archaeon]